jgi:hypothetical protein
MHITAATTTRRPVRQRFAAAVLALLTFASILGLTPTTAEAAAPTTPKILSIQGFATFSRIFIAPPTSTGGKPIAEYQLQRYSGDPQKLDHTWTQSHTAPIVDTDVVPGGTYKFRVRAINEDGYSPWSAFYGAQTNPNLHPLHKFGQDPSAFVKRQYQDLLGRAPGFGELNNAVLALNNGTQSTAQIIDGIAGRPERLDLRHPIIRLYLAYFDRAPDHGGLNYWVGQRSTGKKLDVVSNSFASSSEFKNKYGSLTNAEFVTLVYKNVLKRNPDAGGLAYWTKQLDTAKASRGRVMTQFSESNEHKNTSRGRVVVADIYDDMLHKRVPALELENWSGHVRFGGTAGGYGTRVMLLLDYTS